jgi:hypothetical protein
MKYIFSLFIALFVSVGASAQVRAMTNNGDSVVNTGTESVTYTLSDYTYTWYGTFEIVVSKRSGTIAGNVVIQGSLDGSNWATISDDTLTLANVDSNVYTWEVPRLYYKYYRIKATGSGTMSGLLYGFVFVRKEP